MYKNNISLSVIIKTKNGSEHPTKEFISPLDRQTYIEGREGSNFILRVKNTNSKRVLAIISVDGLSVLDGKPAGETSPGYIIDAFGTLDIPGWKVDSNTAAQFFFAGIKNGEDESYVSQTGHNSENKGVIGIKVFDEEKLFHDVSAMATLGGYQPYSGIRGMSKGITSGSFVCSSANTVVPTSDSIEQLGTGFGQSTKFDTTKEKFKKGSLLVMMVLSYADRKALKKKGIEVDQPVDIKPNPFPADDGCNPPSGWKRG